MEELIVRVKALSKRRSGQVTVLKVAGIELDLDKMKASLSGYTLKLSPIAFKILEVLLRNSPNPVSRDSLVQEVWGDDKPESNSLKVHIFNLRKQLDLAGNKALLQTVSGFGFSIEETKT